MIRNAARAIASLLVANAFAASDPKVNVERFADMMDLINLGFLGISCICGGILVLGGVIVATFKRR